MKKMYPTFAESIARLVGKSNSLLEFTKIRLNPIAEWRQHMLTRTVKNTLQVFVCWLEVDKRIKEGSVVRLKGEKIWWKVTKIFDDLRTKHPPRQDWKVGGLR